MVYLSEDDIKNLNHIFRINLINSCSGFKSANLIGSISENAIENVAVFSSVTHLGSKPPLLSFFVRPTTVPRNTYENIKTQRTLLADQNLSIYNLYCRKQPKPIKTQATTTNKTK